MTTSPHLSRARSRRFLGGICAAALLLAGCGTDAEAPAAGPDPADFRGPVAGALPAGALTGTTMTFAGWGGGYQDGQLEAVVDPFAAATGATILSDGPAERAKLRAQVESGNVTWDVVETSTTRAAQSCGTLFQPLDLSLIDTTALSADLPVGECSVPVMVYGYTFYYDAEVYGDDPPTSAADFFDLDRFPGRRGIEGRANPQPGVYEFALMADGVAPEDLYPLDVERALDMYAGLGRTSFWNTGAESTQLMQGGEVTMMLGWSGRVPEANESGGDWRPVWAGGILDSDVLAVPVGSTNVVAAHALINAFIGAEQQTRHAELTAYPPVNPDAEPELDEFARPFDVSDPETLSQLVAPDHEYWGENVDELDEAWYRFVAQS
ncbi:extracellular solute-binding protein [Brevibacterium litoralis]|uniref:extracellular solute-binding protein n=1 Tax=Brevibacterium litoralis TaxID=3138935 RepID=UPI0032EECCD7